MYNNIDIDLRDSNNFLKKVFLNMTLGIFISFSISIYLFMFNNALLYKLVEYYKVLGILQIGIVFTLSFGIYKFSSGIARIIFLLYSALNGITLTTIGLIYDPMTILYAFAITFVIFSVTSVFGYTTKEDLSSYRKFFMVGLISLIIMSLINIFMGVGPFYWVETIVGVVLFSGLIAYDVNRIKNISYEISSVTGENIEKFAIIGALNLYLDFINLFIYTLRIFGRKK